MLSQIIIAGVISSGGGHLIKNRDNPWFIQNTSSVGYCIETDPATFTMSADVLNGLFTDVLDYWRAEFRHADYRPATGSQSIQLLTQSFIREACDDTTDLRLQFGVLSQDQLTQLSGSDPRDHVAFTIRTDYDEVRLKGKGYLYVSPDNGPNRYRGDEYANGVWHTPEHNKLRLLMIHEIGHILGFSHIPGGYMAEDMPEKLVRRDGGIWNTPRLESTLAFDFSKTWDSNLLDERAANFWEYYMEAIDWRFEFDGRTMVTSARLHGGHPWRTLGTTAFYRQEATDRPTIKLIFRSEQGVFPIDGPGVARFEPRNSIKRLYGRYVAPSGASKEVVVFLDDVNILKIEGLTPDGVQSLVNRTHPTYPTP